MRIIISGSSGFVGQALVDALKNKGHTVVRLVRSEPRAGDEVLWNPISGALEMSSLANTDAVINLGGANIAGRRWTPGYKDELRSSRLLPTKCLAEKISSMGNPPKVMINASAVGFYGDRGDEVLHETSERGEGFLADLTTDWEAASRQAAEAGVRVVFLRLGMVIGAGGALGRMLLPFKFGVGGPIGDGRQYWPWISMDDVVAAVDFALDQETLSGPVNVVSPEETTSRGFAKALGRVLRRPAILPAPAFAVRLLAGEMADALLLSSARVRPEVLQSLGFQFVAPSLEEALSRAIPER